MVWNTGAVLADSNGVPSLTGATLSYAARACIRNIHSRTDRTSLSFVILSSRIGRHVAIPVSDKDNCFATRKPNSLLPLPMTNSSDAGSM